VSGERGSDPNAPGDGGGRSSEVASSDDDDDPPNNDVVVIGGPSDVPDQRVSDPMNDPSDRTSVVVPDDETDPDDPTDSDVVVIDRPVVVPDQRGAEPVRSPIFDIGLVAESPVIPAGLTLTNVPYGGQVRVELNPPASWRPTGEDTLLQLRVPLSEIPNDAWPRSFDLIVVYMIDGVAQSFVWPRPILIPQLVEVGYVGLSGSACRTDDRHLWVGPQRPQGLAIGWYGGGISETSGRAHVEFWLSGDGLVPADGNEDSTHRLVYTGLGSPNLYSESLVDLTTVVLGGLSALNHRDLDRAYAVQREASHRSTLAPGDYSLLAVVDYGEFGRIVTRPDLDPVNVCPAIVDAVLND